MTWKEFINRLIRPQVSDAVGPESDFHWTNSQVMYYMNQMRRMLYTLHPEAFNLTAIQITEPADLDVEGGISASLDATIDIRAQFVDSAMHYVAFLMLSEDSEDAANQSLANDHLQKAIAGGVGWR